MPSVYSAQTRVEVFPFRRQPDGAEVVIGRRSGGDILIVPPEVVEILDLLAAGKTLAQTSAAFRERHGDEPDLADLLANLEAAGFVRPAGDGAPEVAQAAASASSTSPDELGHFAWISTALARRLVAAPVLYAGALLVAAAAAAVIVDPGSLPGFGAAYFPEHAASVGPMLMLYVLGMVFVHESAHLVAARAAGVSCRFGIGNRLWMLVAETDMSGIWLAPRRARYLPFLAGPLADLVGASLLLLVSFAARRGWIAPPETVLVLVRAAIVAYAFALLWQCYLFVRTDFYYVVANALGCRNLMGDTEAWLRGLVMRALGRARPQGEALPAHERRAVRAFAPAWLAGRVLALGLLIFVQLPLAWRYLVALVAALHEGRVGRLDGALFGAVSAAMLVAGLWLWLRGLRRAWRSS